LFVSAGQERFSSMHPSYYHRAHACILVFDVSRKLTYQHLEEWYKELQTYRPGLPTLVVANKIDVDYAVVKKSFAFPSKHAHCAPNLYFCSAADGTNVVKLFEDAIKFGIRYKNDPNEEDFTEEVMSVIEYFDQKEKKDKK
jgi:Rab-like protein 2